MTSPAQLEASEAWRKAGFLVRPYHGHDEEDAEGRLWVRPRLAVGH